MHENSYFFSIAARNRRTTQIPAPPLMAKRSAATRYNISPVHIAATTTSTTQIDVEMRIVINALVSVDDVRDDGVISEVSHLNSYDRTLHSQCSSERSARGTLLRRR